MALNSIARVSCLGTPRNGLLKLSGIREDHRSGEKSIERARRATELTGLRAKALQSLGSHDDSIQLCPEVRSRAANSGVTAFPIALVEST
jgi:hypothetical protein